MSSGLTVTPLVISCEIPGKPIPCPRPRVTHGNTYYPKGYLQWKSDATRLLRDACVRQNKGRLIEGPVKVETWFYGAHGSADGDNLQKSCLDAAQGSVIVNDKQVMQGHWYKLRPLWDKNRPHTLIVITEIEK